MCSDLSMLMDLFLERQPHSGFLIKTNSEQLIDVQAFIAQYTQTHPAVHLFAKAAPYLPPGEYEIHIQSAQVAHPAPASAQYARAAA